MKARLVNTRVAVVIAALWAWVARLACGGVARVAVLAGGIGICVVLFVMISRKIRTSKGKGQSFFSASGFLRDAHR